MANEITVTISESWTGNTGTDGLDDSTATPFDLQVVEYIRVTNIHGSNPVNLQLIIDNAANGTPDASATIYLKAGESWMHWNPDAGITVDDDADTFAVASGDLLGLMVDSISAASLVEIVIASKTAA